MMGSSSSKVARGALRKYPAAPSSSATASRLAPQATRTEAAAAPTEAEAGERNRSRGEDTSAPVDEDVASSTVSADFSQRLQQMGVVQPNPTYSPSSTASNMPSPPGIPNQTIGAPQFAPSRFNPTLAALESRRRLQNEAERELEIMGLSGSTGRRLVDMRTLIDGLQLLSRGMSQAQVEQKLKLEAGLFDKLGGPRAISHEVATGGSNSGAIA